MSCPKLITMPQRPLGGPVVLAIMDGVGLGCGDEGDAVALAKTPNLDRYAHNGLVTQLAAHGVAVGMPSDGDMGNSEVGHNALGSGRVFAQGAKLVREAVTSGRLFEGSVWRRMVAQCREQRSALHLFGLLSDGNVHSHIDHVIALVQRAHAEGISAVYLHVLLDGRDVPKTSALEYVDAVEQVLGRIDGREGRRYRIASGGGRMQITMDRYEADWQMVSKGWRIHVLGEGRQFASARQAIETYRQESPGVIDQDLPGFVVADGGDPVGTMRDGDCVIGFNFRGDRMLEIVQAFDDDEFDKFDRGKRPQVLFAGMTLYDGDTHRPRHYLVAPPRITCTLGELLCKAGVAQMACSETQKYGHVTYFWNGNRSGCFDGSLEKYIEIPSYEPPFDAKPAMRAETITDTVLQQLDTGRFRFLRLNYANGDMVGHTGNLTATVAAVEAVDRCLGRLEKAVLAANGALIVTADHGNADDMAERDKKTRQPKRDDAGELIPRTAHSLNAVPFYVLLPPEAQGRVELSPVDHPGLGNVAATIAHLLGYETPEGYLPSLVRSRHPPA